MSCCCCSAEGAGVTLAGIAAVIVIAFVVINLAAILHFLLMVLIGVLAAGTVVTALGAAVAYGMHRVRAAPTARYTVERVPDHYTIDGEVVGEVQDGNIRQALEAGPAGSIGYGFAEHSDGTLIPVPYRWADGSPVRPIRHSQ